MRINHNIQALNAYGNLSRNQFATGKVMEKLSSGLRINRAADDAAGLAISEKMRGQIRGLNQAERNTLDGISLIQTAEGALQEVHAMLQRMRELAVQAANDTYESADITAIQNEITELAAGIEQIKDYTQFNKKELLNGTQSNINFQIGANDGEKTTIDFSTDGINLSNIHSTVSGVTITDHASASAAITTFQDQIDLVSEGRSLLGAYQNRLEHTLNNITTTAQNLTASESRIRDADMAKEMTEFTKLNIINQSATAMLAQANQLPQGVLQLLKG